MVNGEANKIFVSVENKSDRNITLENVAGSFHHPVSNKVVKNVCILCPSSICEIFIQPPDVMQTTTLPYKLPLLQGAKLQLPYQFHSE